MTNNLQELMIRRELAKDPNLVTESWDRFLPQFRKRHLKTSEKTAKKNEKAEATAEARKAAGVMAEGPSKSNKPTKKVYTPFPPPQLPRKVGHFVHAFFPNDRPLMCFRSTCNSSLVNISSRHTKRKHAKRTEGRRKYGRFPSIYAIIVNHTIHFLARRSDYKTTCRTSTSIRCTSRRCSTARSRKTKTEAYRGGC
jgi:hypothetical protein